MFNISLPKQTFNAAYALFGIPFIIGGIMGVMYRLETHTRLYLYYAIITFFLDMFLVISNLLLNDVCTMLPPVLQRSGEAFACGAARIGSIVIIAAVSVVEGYFCYVIWSLCQDQKAGGCGGKLPDLLATAEQRKNKRKMDSDYHNNLYAMQAAASGIIPGYGTSGHNRQPKLVGGSHGIFHGKFHDCQYPPKLKEHM